MDASRTYSKQYRADWQASRTLNANIGQNPPDSKRPPSSLASIHIDNFAAITNRPQPAGAVASLLPFAAIFNFPLAM
jgi:hypothetical protein